MGSKKPKEKKVKDHLGKEEWAIGNALCSEEDRGCVLVACAFAERELEGVLATFFNEVGNAPTKLINQALNSKSDRALFSSGWAKATCARLIGAIGDEAYALFNLLRELRNDFAHHGGCVSLTEKAVAPLLDFLGEPQREDLSELLERHKEGKSIYGHPAAKFTEQRIGFMVACIFLYALLYQHRISRRPPDYPTGVLVANYQEDGQHHMSFIHMRPAPPEADEQQPPN
jgi:hypothetical protein